MQMEKKLSKRKKALETIISSRWWRQYDNDGNDDNNNNDNNDNAVALF